MEKEQVNNIQNELASMDFDKLFGDLEATTVEAANSNEDPFANLDLGSVMEEIPAESESKTEVSEQPQEQASVKEASEPADDMPQKEAEVKEEQEKPAEKQEEEPQEEVQEQEATEETTKEKKPKRKTTRRRVSKKASGEADAESADEETDNVPTITLPLTDNVDILKMLENVPVIPASVAQEKHAQFDEMMKKIQIRKDIDKANAADLLDKIDELSDLLYPEYTFYRTYEDNLYNSNASLIDVLKATHAFGSNANIRKGSGFKAMIEYTDPTSKKKTNLIHLIWAIHAEVLYYTDMLTRIENKRRLINQQIELLVH